MPLFAASDRVQHLDFSERQYEIADNNIDLNRKIKRMQGLKFLTNSEEYAR